MQEKNGSLMLNKIIMGIAVFLLSGLVYFMTQKIDSQGKEISNAKIEIGRMQEQNKAISDRQNDILAELRDINRKLDRHMEYTK